MLEIDVAESCWVAAVRIGYLPEPSIVAVEFQTQLRDNLGIEAEVVVMESGEFIDESTNGRARTPRCW